MVPNPMPTAESGPRLLEGAGWFDANWMFVSGVLCPLSLLLMFKLIKGSLEEKLRNPLFAGWLTVPVYCLHQVEEHAYDLRGWRYAFVPSFNHGTGSQLFSICDKTTHLTCPLDVRTTMYVNVLLVWVGFSLTMVAAHVLGGRYALAGLFNWGTATVNGLGGHLLPALFSLSYNPGALQSLMMVPMGILLTTRCGLKYFGLCMLCGALAHIIMFAIGINLVLKVGLPAPVEAALVLFCSTALPLAFASCVPVDLDDTSFVMKPYRTMEDEEASNEEEEDDGSTEQSD
mmetsp:Transcript_13230/g.30035  ORF Transcript_13230/g.30035 Transcript_13230/m.30035 type:complete len:287 (-) Transcript_13230:87-947(-)